MFIRLAEEMWEKHMDKLIESLKEAFNTTKKKVIAAITAFIIAALGAVQTGIVDFSEVAAAFVGDKAAQVEETQND